MPEIAQRTCYTVAEYVDLERLANVRHEFLDGAIYALAGGTPEHGAMAARVTATLVAQLRGRRYNVYTSDVRVRVVPTGLITYPDLSVVCGAERRDDEDRLALTNPVVVVEVSSPGTESYDRGAKLAHYQQIPSLREIVFVSHREPLIELWRRAPEGWHEKSARRGEVVVLESVDCRLDVDEVYRDPFAG